MALRVFTRIYPNCQHVSYLQFNLGYTPIGMGVGLVVYDQA